MGIIDNILIGLQMITWHSLAALIIGTAIGIIVGALPGMGVTMGVILALPFTFTMNSITAILFLVGIYKGAVYGGSISAILIRTPGVPSAAATILDGYQLNKQGKAGKALNMAIYSSVVADSISNLALITFAALLATLALRFGPPEFCALILFSLTIIAGVAGEYLIRGLLSGALGLLAATVGMDEIYSSTRFTFGNINLMAGLSFIPVVVGIFAIPEIVSKFLQRKRIHQTEKVDGKLGERHVSWQEFRGCLKTIIRGSIIGVILGAIPGIGAAPAAFLSYNEAKRSSKNPELFGKGKLEGVAAAEAGNNGVCGATLIPLLTLGIPGDITTAVMLGAFMMQGLIPGPMLFKEHGDIVYGIFVGIIFSSLALFVLGKIAVRLFTRLSMIFPAFLFPVILIMCVFGTYAVKKQLFDVLVMFCFGVIGFVMEEFDIPPAPFLIGFILSPMFENNLRRALRMSEGDPSIFFTRPISLLFVILAFISIVLFVKKRYQMKSVRAGA